MRTDMTTYMFMHFTGREMTVRTKYYEPTNDNEAYYCLDIGTEFGSRAHIFIDEKQIYQLVKELVDKTGIEISPEKE